MNWTPIQQQALLNVIQRRNERDIIRRQLAQTTSELSSLQQQRNTLHDQWQQEQYDVDRLNRLSWVSVFYTLLNRKEQQLSQEEAEAQQARLQYDAITDTLTTLQQQHDSQQTRLTSFSHVDTDYEQLTSTKRLVLNTGQRVGYEPYQNQLAVLTNSTLLMQELEEAHQAGLKALDEVTHLTKLLSQARTLGTWDLLGGSVLSSAMKYNKLDAVRDQSYRVTRQLQQFRAEYADLNRTFMADWQFDNGATRFVDIFFDNIFTDASVQSRISHAHETAQALENELITAIGTLKSETEQAVERARQEAEKLQLLLETL